MSKVLSFIKLDFLTIKPYLAGKNIIIMVFLPFFLMWGNRSAPFSAGFVMLFGALFISYPFSAGEKNGIDLLYATLSITRNTVVLGRYLFALSLNLCAGVLAYTLIFLASMVMNIDFQYGSVFSLVLALLVVYSVVQAFQLPVYFKLGYSKAKFIVYIPLVVFPFIVAALSTQLENTGLTANLYGLSIWIENNPSLLIAASIVLWLVIEFVSYSFALKFYQKRDF